MDNIYKITGPLVSDPTQNHEDTFVLMDREYIKHLHELIDGLLDVTESNTINIASLSQRVFALEAMVFEGVIPDETKEDKNG